MTGDLTRKAWVGAWEPRLEKVREFALALDLKASYMAGPDDSSILCVEAPGT